MRIDLVGMADNDKFSKISVLFYYKKFLILYLETHLKKWPRYKCECSKGKLVSKYRTGIPKIRVRVPVEIHVFHINESCFQFGDALTSGPKKNPNLG